MTGVAMAAGSGLARTMLGDEVYSHFVLLPISLTYVSHLERSCRFRAGRHCGKFCALLYFLAWLNL